MSCFFTLTAWRHCSIWEVEVQQVGAPRRQQRRRQPQQPRRRLRTTPCSTIVICSVGRPRQLSVPAAATTASPSWPRCLDGTRALRPCRSSLLNLSLRWPLLWRLQRRFRPRRRRPKSSIKQRRLRPGARRSLLAVATERRGGSSWHLFRVLPAAAAATHRPRSPSRRRLPTSRRLRRTRIGRREYSSRHHKSSNHSYNRSIRVRANNNSHSPSPSFILMRCSPRPSALPFSPVLRQRRQDLACSHSCRSTPRASPRCWDL